jgi:hypothetical protein
MADEDRKIALIQAAATLVVPALTDTGTARRLMGQPPQAGAKAPDIWELFDYVLARLEDRVANQGGHGG